MEEIKIKSNGLRNELKEIRKSIDALTKVLKQTNKHGKSYIINSDSQYPGGMWKSDTTNASKKE